jgi:hypothetical protein
MSWIEDRVVYRYRNRTAAYSDTTLDEVMAGMGLLMVQSVIVNSPFFSESEIQKYLKLRRSYHGQFAEACADLADTIEEDVFGSGARPAVMPLRQVGATPPKQARKGLRLVSRALRGLKRLDVMKGGGDPRILRLIRMAEMLRPDNPDRETSDYETFLRGLLRVKAIPAPVRTLLRKALKNVRYTKPDETANPGAWFELAPETKQKLKGLLEETQRLKDEAYEKHEDPEERRAAYLEAQRQMDKIQNAAGVNPDIILKGDAPALEPLNKVLSRESKLQADGPTEFVLEKIQESIRKHGPGWSYKGKGVPQEVRKIITQISKARNFDTMRRIVQEAIDRKVLASDFAQTVENIASAAGKNLAVRNHTKLTPLEWTPVSAEDFQAKHSTGIVRFDEKTPEDKQREILGRVSRAMEDLEGIFGKGFAGKHDKPLDFHFDGGGAFAKASYFAWDRPDRFQPRVKFGDDYEGLMAHELSHYFDDLLANKIEKQTRPDAPEMSRDLFGSTGVDLEYVANNDKWMERLGGSIPELAEFAKTIVETEDFARWKDMTSVGHETGINRAVKNLTGEEYYDLPENHPYRITAQKLPQMKSEWPPELLKATEDAYRDIMNGDVRKLTYYNSGVETWARMIEQYVYTKLAQAGIANPWLTQMTYDLDVLPQAMGQKTFEEKLLPILDRLFAKLRERKLLASVRLVATRYAFNQRLAAAYPFRPFALTDQDLEIGSECPSVRRVKARYLQARSIGDPAELLPR